MMNQVFTIVRILLICFIWQNQVFSSEPGPEDCVKNVTMSNISNNSIVYVPNEILCFICTPSINGYNFSINGTEILNSGLPARVVINFLSDILIVFEVFNSFLTLVKCVENSPGHHITPEYNVRVSLYDLNPPLVEKESTTITEGNTVNLRCDGSNSIPQPSLKWISPNGTVISETGHVEIVDITENETGLYTCIATLPSSNVTTYSTLLVQFINSTPVTTESIMTSSPTMDCPGIEKTNDGMVRPYRVGVIVLSVIVLVQTLLLVGATAKIILLIKKKGEEKTKEEKLEMNMNEAYAVPKHVIAHSVVR